MTRQTSTVADPAWHERLIERVQWLAALALVLLVPMVWEVGSDDPFRGPKATIALVAWAILAAGFLVRNLGGPVWSDRWWPVWAALLAGALLSAPLSGNPPRVVVAAVPLALAALGWGSLRQLASERRGLLTELLIVSGTLQALLTVAFLSPNIRPTSYAAGAGQLGRELWIGTMGNPGDVAMFLVVPALLALDLAVADVRRRWWHAGAAALMTSVVTGSQSLSGTAALAAGAAMIVLLRIPRRLRLRSLAVAVVAIAVVTVATPVGSRIQRVGRNLAQGRWSWIGSGRVAGYQAAIGMAAENPATGAGFGLYEAKSYEFQSEELLSVRGHDLGLVTGFGDAHNDLLQHLGETGTLGVALLAAAVWLAVRRKPRVSEAPISWRPVAVGATVLLLLQFPLHVPAVAAQWVVIFALAVAPLAAAPSVTALRGALAAVAVLLVSALAVTGGWLHHRATVAHYQGKLLVQTLRTMQVTRTGPEVARRAMANLEQRRLWLPYSWELEVTLGNLAMEAGNPARALNYFTRALALAERPETRFNVGMALMATGDRAAGFEHLQRAVRLNPAIFRQIANPEIARALRDRLDANGYGLWRDWMYRGTPAASPRTVQPPSR